VSFRNVPGGFTEFVPLWFIPFQTLLGRVHGVQEVLREENLKHTAAFRLALGHTITNLQASWVKMGLDAATEALSWGVNDLGGTLMEESIRPHGRQLPRGELEARRADRRGAPGRASRRRAQHAL
jgi:FO synthase